MSFAIEPHRGLGPVSFGMTREEVAAAMAGVGAGPPKARRRQTDCFFRSAFQVSFGNAGRVDFIEVASSLPAEVLFAGQDVLDTPADDLLALIQQFDRADAELSHPPNEFVFPELILTLWGRDRQYDHKGGRRRPMFAAVGVGGPTYLDAIRGLRRGKGKTGPG
jgi:hypothetical protein